MEDLSILTAYNETHRSCFKAALLLFGSCLILLFGILLLNRSIVNRSKQFQELSDWSYTTSFMVEKVRAYRSRTPFYFQGLVLAVIVDNISLKKGEKRDRVESILQGGASQWQFLKSTEKEMYVKSGSGEEFEYVPPEYWRLVKESYEFAQSAAYIFQKTTKVPERAKFLERAAEASFHGESDRKALKKFLERIANSDSVEEWLDVSFWIVFSKYPLQGITSEGWRRRDDSYLERGSSLWDESGRKFYLHSLLVSKGRDDAEKILVREADIAELGVRDAGSRSIRIEFNVGNIPVSINDLLLVAGPLSLILQLLYVLFWKKAQALKERLLVREPEGSLADLLRFGFPQFESPNDPLTMPWSCKIAALVERFIWGLFLILPTVLLIIGVVTRYDLVSFSQAFGHRFFDRSILSSLTPWLRNDDFVSILLDFVNLGCLTVSLGVLLSVTSHSERALPKIQCRATLMMVKYALTAAFVLAWGFSLYRMKSAYLPQHDFWLFGFFGLVLLSYLIWAMKRKSATVAIFCAGWLSALLYLTY
jgi:hypothetical protein